MNILEIRSSINGEAGASSALADRFVASIAATQPGVDVFVRDLARDPIPHLDAQRFKAFITADEARTETEREHARFSDALVAELRRADVLVIGLPMYNFGIPSTLKAYFDHVARAGQTFRYTEKGPVGLLTGKRAVVFATRGGMYAGTPLDSQTSYIRAFLGFLGITDVDFVYAEGLALGDSSRQSSLDAAHATLDRAATAVTAGAGAADITGAAATATATAAVPQPLPLAA